LSQRILQEDKSRCKSCRGHWVGIGRLGYEEQPSSLDVNSLGTWLIAFRGHFIKHKKNDKI